MISSESTNTNQGFSAESLRKKIRPSEFIAEKIITGIAILSIAVIVLIFLFVFKEAFPIFKHAAEKAPASTSVTANSPERYGEESTTAKPEQYGVSADSQNKPMKPEQYGVATETQKEPMQPERYGVEEEQQKTESTGVTEDSAISSSEEIPATDYMSGSGTEESAWKTLPGKEWLPVSDRPRYGLQPLIIGTLKITLISILIAAPLAILAALFSAAFAPRWMREFVKPAIELLAGFPSVVIGFFALMVMATFFQNVFGYETRLNAFVGGVAMALAAIPIIFTISEDMMTAVPSTYKEASLALGASKWQTAFFVTLPAATPGIFAAVLLGIGRIFGETMIALMATGNAAMMGLNPFESVRTLAATIGAEMAEVVFGDTHYNVLFLIGALLFVFTFAINAIAEFYIKGKLMRRFQGRKA